MKTLLILMCLASWTEEVRDLDGWNKVKATREGLVGHKTASGHLIEEDDIFVALPHPKVLGRYVVVKYGNMIIAAEVKDVGPHSIGDAYWETGSRPLSEQGKRIPKRWGKAKNGAGIDLSNGLWDELDIERGVGIVEVEWKLLSDKE